VSGGFESAVSKVCDRDRNRGDGSKGLHVRSQVALQVSDGLWLLFRGKWGDIVSCYA
jgi:hypothetical protein